MTEDTGVDQRHAALASQSRRAVLDLLARSPAPLDSAGIADQIDLHITTVRFHLEHLERAGLVSRAPSPAGKRGRPRVLFTLTPAARSDEGHRQLAEVLADALSSDPDGGKARAVAAGERWADASIESMGISRDGDTTAPLLTMLDRLGFGPELSGEDGHRAINLFACPFRDTAVAYPDVVCSVHRGLVQRALSAFGSEGDAARLLPFVKSDLCVVPLTLAEDAAEPEGS